MTKPRPLRALLPSLLDDPPPPPPPKVEPPAPVVVEVAPVTQHARDAVTQHARDASRPAKPKRPPPAKKKAETPPKPANRAGSRRHPYPTADGQLKTRITLTVTEGFADLLEELTPSKLPLRRGERMKRSEFLEEELDRIVRRQLARAAAAVLARRGVTE